MTVGVLTRGGLPSWRRMSLHFLVGAGLFFVVAIAVSLLFSPLLGLRDLRLESILWGELLRHPQELIFPLVQIIGGLILVSLAGSILTVGLPGPLRGGSAVVLWTMILGRALEQESFLFSLRNSPGSWLRDFILSQDSLKRFLESALPGQTVVVILALVCVWRLLAEMVRSQERISGFRRRQVLRDLDREFKSLSMGTAALLLCLASAGLWFWALGGPLAGGWRIPEAPGAAQQGSIVVIAIPPREDSPLAREQAVKFFDRVRRTIGSPERVSGSVRGVSSESLPRWFSFFSGEVPSNIGLWHDFPPRANGASMPTMLPAVAAQRGYLTAAAVSDDSYFLRNFPFGFKYISVEPLTIKNISNGFLAGNVRAFASVVRLPRVCSLFSYWCLVAGESDWGFRRRFVEDLFAEAGADNNPVLLMLRGDRSDSKTFSNFSTGLLAKLKRSGWLRRTVVVVVEESSDPMREGRFALWDLRGRGDAREKSIEKTAAREFDFAPTLADLAGIPFPVGLVDGSNLVVPEGKGQGLFPRNCVWWNGWRTGGTDRLKIQSDWEDGGRLVALSVENSDVFSHQRTLFSCGDAMVSSSWNALDPDWQMLQRDGERWRPVAGDPIHLGSEFAALMRRRGFLLYAAAPDRWSLMRGAEP